MSELSLSKIHQQVVKLIPSINERLRLGFSKTNKVSYKTSPQLSVSVVTHLDSQIENFLKKALKKILPQAGFIGEETGVNVRPEYNWIIDPIDGTLNFANKIPVFAVSIALWYKNQPVYTLASFPISNEIIHALKSGGIFLNQKKIKPKFNRLKQKLLVYSMVGSAEEKQAVFAKICHVSSVPRSYGSCVFHGVNIALGRIDAGVFVNQAVWDIGAIILLCQEAGLTIKYTSAPPNLGTDNLKTYQYSMVIGSENLANQLYDHLLF
ncbi:MAG: inositol monophosphatase [Candidatus Beckwithbacteria bacterium]|nr:inositol monophosphatase [Candidatus Beckwithbacteria bacterium]